MGPIEEAAEQVQAALDRGEWIAAMQALNSIVRDKFQVLQARASGELLASSDRPLPEELMVTAMKLSFLIRNFSTVGYRADNAVVVAVYAISLTEEVLKNGPATSPGSR